MKTQEQMYYQACKIDADINSTFLEMVNCKSNPMTKQDLQKLIKKRPALYSRFSNWMDKLPNEVVK